MHPRYENKRIKEIWGDENKLRLWQATEVAVLEALHELGAVTLKDLKIIKEVWERHNPDVEWWKARDKEINHDLNAFLDERLRHLDRRFQQHVHKKITSYDTEEPAFATMLKASGGLVLDAAQAVLIELETLARRYRFTIMNGRTHGQEAELQSFGKRCLTWYKDLKTALEQLTVAGDNLRYSKISGAIGNYGSIDPELERRALVNLGLEPYYGSTQIMPRLLYAPLAQALATITLVVHKIALDIRQGARSGRPILQEPFGKKQKGSSAMPHKKNTIATEKIEGLARMAKGYLGMIMDNIATWEERAIEQSCVERVAWPDLFHATVHSLETLRKVLAGLQVYPDNMLREIRDSRGCYASSEAKELLKERLSLGYEDVYRIVQLAAFNAFHNTRGGWILFEGSSVGSLEGADRNLEKAMAEHDPFGSAKHGGSISDLILKGKLESDPNLEAGEDQVGRWNKALKELFRSPKTRIQWLEIFRPSYLLRHEAKLFREILEEE